MSADDQTRFLFRLPELPGVALEVLRLSGRETLSQLYSFEIELVSADRAVDLAKMVNRMATLVIRGAQAPRHVHGIVLRAEQVGITPRRGLYHVTLAPPHARLGYQRRLRIFQHLTTRQIVTQVLSEAGARHLDWKLKAKYMPRDYCVQYRETDLGFISRLLEEEGISFHFVHQDEELHTVFMDAASEREPIAGAEAVSYDEERSMVSTEERVHSLSFGQGIAVSNVELRDFSFRAPQEPVTGTKAAEGGGGLESYDYPGEFTEPELAERLAQVRLEELSTSRESGAGASDCNRLVPGHCFTLGAPLPGGAPVGAALPGRHPRRGLNQKYLLLAVSHNGSQPQVMGEEGTGGTTEYSNIFEVIPASVEYRPPRVTRRPIALNTHTATVVGPEGEEIYVDKFGRVKVHFHWDREGKHDEKASCWVRVSQDWAGSGYGGMFVPRVGQEVLVSFLEGDPDRPLVTGRVYNGAQSKAYDPQAQRTLSSFKSASSPGGKGSNELSFEDKAGAEKLGFVAQKDNSTVVGDDSTTVIGASRAEEVKGNDEVNVATTSTLLADDVFQEGRSKVTICVGASSITVTPGSITFSSPAIFVGSLDTAIKGGLVRIN